MASDGHGHSHGGGATMAAAGSVDDHAARGQRAVEGHIEIRWSHGRFGGPPEAKVNHDTPHQLVPGYWPLT